MMRAPMAVHVPLSALVPLRGKTTIYGTVTFARTNIQNGDVTCDGLEVHSPGQTIVPVTVKAVPVEP